MSKLIKLPVIKDSRGSLTVIEKLLPFNIKRVYFIYNANGLRGGHRHKLTRQALICLSGSCSIYINNGITEEKVELKHPNHCLLIDPEDWHTMQGFKNNTILLVLASEYYDVKDYINESYD